MICIVYFSYLSISTHIEDQVEYIMSDTKNVMSEIQSNSDSTKPPPPKKREDKRRVTTSPNDALQNESDSDATIPLAFNSKRDKSLSKYSLELDTSDEEDEDDEDDSIRVPSQKRKAILFSDEDDSDDSERNNHKDRIQKKKWTNNEEDIEDLVDTDSDDEDEDEDLMMAKKEYNGDLSKKRKVDCIDLQSSSSDEDSSSDEEVLVSKKPFKKRSAKEERRRSNSVTGKGWIKRNDESDSSSSSSSSSESDLDETDKKLDRLDWLSSDSRDDKLNYLTTIECDKDKVLQLLLWDCGFDFNIHTHQFEAVRFVAGYIASFPVSNASAASSDDDSDQEEDDEAVQKHLQEMLQLDIIGFHARQQTLIQPTLMLKERGMLLADEMG